MPAPSAVTAASHEQRRPEEVKALKCQGTLVSKALQIYEVHYFPALRFNE